MAAIKKTPVAKTKVTPKVEKEDVNLSEELEALRQELEDIKARKGSEAPSDVHKMAEDFGMKVKRQCDEGEKVKLTIPFNAHGEDEIVEINLSGYKWQIRRGEETTVPKAIADIWNESYRNTLAAERKITDKGKEIGVL